MSRVKRWFLVVIAPVVTAAILNADVVLAPLFQDHAILQRDKPIIIWGKADPTENVAVTFGNQTAIGTADTTGKWSVQLDPLPFSITPSELVVRGKNRIVLRDILVGDVWLCSGQSNMAWSVGAASNPDAEIAAADWPQIRQIKIGLTIADVPQDRVDGAWSVCSPCTVATYTAAGYYFAREIYRRLKIPIGIINCSFGGSSIEAWISATTLNVDPAFNLIHERWDRAKAAVTSLQREDYEAAFASWKTLAERSEEGLVVPAKPWPPAGEGSFLTPSGLFNGMLHPLIPYTLRGILWYQGESNAERAGEYHRLFVALIESWRKDFKQGNIPFYWVQLPNFRAKDETNQVWALLREAQTQTLSVPATGQAIAIDIGNPDYIHPANKQEVGRRLALIALGESYGSSEKHSGPQFLSSALEGSSVRVYFDHVGQFLRADADTLQAFELAGTDNIFYPGRAQINSRTITVNTPQVPFPVRLRYAWQNAPNARLYNEEGLPAGPFNVRIGDSTERGDH